MRDIRQSSQYAKYLSTCGWIVENKSGVSYFVKKFSLVGSFIKVQRPERINIKDIKLLAKKYRAFQVIIEPKIPIDAKYTTQLGFKITKSPYLPSKTLYLDLHDPMMNTTDSVGRKIGSMKKDARLALEKTKNLKVEEVRNLESFAKNWRSAVGWGRSAPSYKDLRNLKKSFGKNFVAYQCIATLIQEEVLAGGVFLIADGIGYYWKAFTSEKGRKELAQYRVVWEGIKWTKKNRAKIFDFEGIYDERFPIPSWKGFSHFKRSFGGYEVEYPGTYSKYLLPF